MRTEKCAFSVLEPCETNKNVLKFCKHWVLKFYFLFLGALGSKNFLHPFCKRLSIY